LKVNTRIIKRRRDVVVAVEAKKPWSSPALLPSFEKSKAPSRYEGIMTFVGFHVEQGMLDIDSDAVDLDIRPKTLSIIRKNVW